MSRSGNTADREITLRTDGELSGEQQQQQQQQQESITHHSSPKSHKRRRKGIKSATKFHGKSHPPKTAIQLRRIIERHSRAASFTSQIIPASFLENDDDDDDAVGEAYNSNSRLRIIGTGINICQINIRYFKYRISLSDEYTPYKGEENRFWQISHK
ncbi:hypothetical protein EAI_14974 [Harpegnathos saltator]|uniref:Uncharacterized protein n=1 Tax=Harpegnathos saltator TaxID=610380 RepID=E2C2R0_HARSA|nr:hypothetical protein EAI_14974 [Harpegnathos saltator]